MWATGALTLRSLSIECNRNINLIINVMLEQQYPIKLTKLDSGYLCRQIARPTYIIAMFSNRRDSTIDLFNLFTKLYSFFWAPSRVSVFIKSLTN